MRDELLGRPVEDRDWVVIGATPEELERRGFRQIGNEFPCFLHPETKEEYALARTERKSGSGHRGFLCDFGPHVTLEDDLSRRDLTINAIAKTADGEYVDPFGGRADLEARVLRHVSEAFAEDPLRVLRVARFAARYAELGFRVHEDTRKLMQRLVASDELAELTAERVWKEVSRALAEPRPSEFVRVLRACGALSVILPELERLFGVPQPPEHHPEVDTGEHVLLAIDMARRLFDEPSVTWAVLLHDLGKGLTPSEEWPSHIGHEKAGAALANEVSVRLKAPREFARLSALAAEHHTVCHRFHELRPATVWKLVRSIDGLRRPERLLRFTQACEADARGRKGREEREYPQARLLIACADAARTVDTKPLRERGLRGPELAEPIRRLQIEAIARVLRAAGAR